MLETELFMEANKFQEYVTNIEITKTKMMEIIQH